MILEKILRYKKRPHILAFILIKIFIAKFKTIKYILKYKFINGNICISLSAKFNQKTIFTGKGKIILKNKISIGYKLGGHYWNGLTEIQARYPSSEVIIYDDVSFNNSNFILAAKRIEIQAGCRIGANVTMMDFEAHGTHPYKRDQTGMLGEILIGENVWIGNNVIILKNVNIGKNSIVAAGSVVLKGNYPANCIIGGNPAKVIKKIEDNN